MKIIVTAALGLAIAFTLNACSQKKKLATELAAQAATLTDIRGGFSGIGSLGNWWTASEYVNSEFRWS